MATYNVPSYTPPRTVMQPPIGGGTVGSGQRGFSTTTPTVANSPQGSAISPQTAGSLANGLKGFMGGGAGAGSTAGGWEFSAAPYMGGGTAAGGTAAGVGGGAGGGTAAAAGGSAAGGGGGSALMAAGPWAALAAAIAINEEDSRKKGLRAEDHGERAKDMISGKVMTQDIDGKWGPMFDKWTGGKASDYGFVGDMSAGSKIASGRISSGFKDLYKNGTTGKIVNALRKIF